MLGFGVLGIEHKQAPHVSIVVWEPPDENSQRLIEKMIDENISRFAKRLAPKTMTVSGQVAMDFSDLYAGKA